MSALADEVDLRHHCPYALIGEGGTLLSQSKRLNIPWGLYVWIGHLCFVIVVMGISKLWWTESYSFVRQLGLEGLLSPQMSRALFENLKYLEDNGSEAARSIFFVRTVVLSIAGIAALVVHLSVGLLEPIRARPTAISGKAICGIILCAAFLMFLTSCDGSSAEANAHIEFHSTRAYGRLVELFFPGKEVVMAVCFWLWPGLFAIVPVQLVRNGIWQRRNRVVPNRHTEPSVSLRLIRRKWPPVTQEKTVDSEAGNDDIQ